MIQETTVGSSRWQGPIPTIQLSSADPTYFYEREDCRMCGSSPLETVLDLGMQWIISFGDKPDRRAPLELVKCPSCHLVQLRHTVDPEVLFRSYFYKSSVNKSMREALHDLAECAVKRVILGSGDAVIDIGSNDGTLLDSIRTGREVSLHKIGFEPSQLAKEAEEKKSGHIIHDFFSADRLRREFSNGPEGNLPWKVKIIFCAAMFYDLDDPNKFLEDVKAVMVDDGLLVIQMNYLLSMLTQNDFSNIVHEHLCYYSVTTLTYLLERHGFWVEEVEFNETNGGSFRAYIRKEIPHSHAQEPPRHGSTVVEAMKREAEMGLDKLYPYKDFAAKVRVIAKKLREFVAQESVKGKTFFIAGFSTRGNTLLQACDLIPVTHWEAVERNPSKWGKTVKWAGIEVVSEKMADELPPDYYLLLPFHFADEFVSRMRKNGQLLKGTKILVPLPVPYIVEANQI